MDVFAKQPALRPALFEQSVCGVRVVRETTRVHRAELHGRVTEHVLHPGVDRDNTVLRGASEQPDRRHAVETRIDGREPRLLRPRTLRGIGESFAGRSALRCFAPDVASLFSRHYPDARQRVRGPVVAVHGDRAGSGGYSGKGKSRRGNEKQNGGTCIVRVPRRFSAACLVSPSGTRAGRDRNQVLVEPQPSNGAVGAKDAADKWISGRSMMPDGALVREVPTVRIQNGLYHRRRCAAFHLLAGQVQQFHRLLAALHNSPVRRANHHAIGHRCHDSVPVHLCGKRTDIHRETGGSRIMRTSEMKEMILRIYFLR